MGGLAIKKIIGREGDRFTRTELSEYKEIISGIFPSPMTCFPVEVSSKETFGDLDVLVDSTYVTNNFEKYIRNGFEKHGIDVQGVAQNSNVYSFSIGNKQVDFVMLGTNLAMAFHYYSNNDFGNLLGRIARNLGLKLGYNGLLLVIRDGDHYINEIKLTHDFKSILQFLGFGDRDIDFYFKLPGGFNDFEELYRFVTRSKYFDGSKYDLDQLNQINRIRNVKRKTYMDFIDFLNSNPELKNKRPDDFIHQPYFQLEAVLGFGVSKSYIQAIYEVEANKYYSSKFNGDIVKEVTGFEGKELGNFISRFKKKYQKETLMYMSPDKIKRLIDIERSAL